MGVAALGDGAEAARRTARVLARYEAEEGHELLGMNEASQVAEFGEYGDGGDEFEAAQGGDGGEQRLQPPVRRLVAQRGGEPFDAFVGVAHGAAILGVGDVLRGMGEADGGCPASLWRVANAIR